MSQAKTVMWVEDKPASVKWYVAYLEREGCSVDMVADAESALEELISACEAYDVVIMDVMLPLGEAFPHHLPAGTTNERAGLELVRALRESKHKHLQALPVIVYSAMSGMSLWPNMESELRRLGAAILTKPIERQRLLQLVRELTSRTQTGGG